MTKAKPTHLKLITGNPGKRPILPDAIQPPKRDRVLGPPAHLSAPARAEWKRLAPTLHKIGLLSDLDRAAFAAYCQAYGRWKIAEDRLADLARKDASGLDAMVITTKNGNAIHNPVLAIANRAMHDMVRYATEFGFTPSARARVHDEAPKSAKSGAGRFFDD